MEYVVLSSGCVCCTTQAELTNTVAKALFRRQHGLLPPFERFVLETTGAADPYTLIASFGHRGNLSHLCYLDSVIVTVDGLLGERQLLEHPEVAAHVQAADHLVITKADLCATAPQRLRSRLQGLNPMATVSVSPGAGEVWQVLSSSLRDPISGEANWQRWLRLRATVLHSAPVQPRMELGVGDLEHATSIQTHGVILDQCIDFRKWCDWVASYVQRYGQRLLRLKAILHTNQFAGPIAFDAVRDIVHAPTELPPHAVPDRRSRIVVMCRDVEPLELSLIDAALRETQVAPDER